MHLLIVSSETPERQARGAPARGRRPTRPLADVLSEMAPDATLADQSCVAREAGPDLARFDGAVFAGSPIRMHEDTPETRASATFVGRVFAAGPPAFGSCAGLQIAAVAAGGAARAFEGGMEAGFARGV